MLHSMSCSVYGLWLQARDHVVERLDRLDARSEAGQSTAEYAMVILGAVALGGLLLAWAAKSHAITRLFDATIGQVVKLVKDG